MSLLETLYDEHELLLQSRGINEQEIGSPFRQKTFLEELRRNIGIALNASETSEMPSVFVLKTIGSYGEDMWQMNLHYQFDPVLTSLDLFALDGLWGPHQSTFKLKSSYELPIVKEAFNQLKEETQKSKRQGKAVRLQTPKKYKRQRKHL